MTTVYTHTHTHINTHTHMDALIILTTSTTDILTYHDESD